MNRKPMNGRPGRMPDGCSVATATLAFRIWQAATPRAWDVTLDEIADEIGESVHRVRRVAQLKLWLGRFRVTHTDPTGAAIRATDEALEAMGTRG